MPKNEISESDMPFLAFVAAVKALSAPNSLAFNARLDGRSYAPAFRVGIHAIPSFPRCDERGDSVFTGA